MTFLQVMELVLHWASLALQSAGLLVGTLTAWMLWKKLSKTSAITSAISQANSTFVSRSRLASFTTLLFLVGCALDVHLLYQEFHRNQSWELHDVRVLDRADDYTFRMDVEDPTTGRRNVFMAKFCPNFEPTNEIQPGATFSLLKYEEDHHLHCLDVDAPHMGYILRRDANGNVVTDAGSSTARAGESGTTSTASPTAATTP